MDYLRRVTKNSKKYGRDCLKNGKFGGMKWINITVQEMLHFYGLMIRIYIEPRHIGWCTSYFGSIPRIVFYQGFTVSIDTYGGWSGKSTSLFRFRQILTAYHAELWEYKFGDKCHQLIFLIRCINWASERTFYLGPNAAFYEGCIATRIRFCRVRKYNKYKPEKFRIDFFVLSESKYYFVRNLDVYQGKNSGNIYIRHRAKQLTTTTKAFINAVLASNISNDHYGAQKYSSTMGTLVKSSLRSYLNTWTLLGLEPAERTE